MASPMTARARIPPPSSRPTAGGAPRDPATEDGIVEVLCREFRHGVLTIWVMEALAEGPASPVYEILERLRVRAGPSFPVWPSAVYRALGRLRSWGFVTVVRETGRGGAVRRHYDLTEAGRAAYPAVTAIAEQSWRGSRRPPETRPGLAGDDPTSRGAFLLRPHTGPEEREGSGLGRIRTPPARP